MKYEEAFSSINNGEEEEGKISRVLSFFKVCDVAFCFYWGDRGKQKQTKKDPIRSFLQELKAFTVDYNTMG